MTYPTIVVEVAFTVGGTGGTAMLLGDVARGLLDTATLSAEAWQDVTAYAKSLSTRRGANRAEGPVLRFEAGSATIVLDNSDRRFDPTNISGPYVGAGVTQVTPMRQVRISAAYAGISYPVFTGYADSWDISYSEPSDSTCTLTATDATKVLANYDRVALGSPVGASELSGTRVHRILDSVAWPVGSREIAAGDSTMQGTTMDQAVWEELLKVQDSEIGGVYVDARGYVVFRNRLAPMTDPASTTSQATFGDDVGEIPFMGATTVYDDTSLNNLVRISNVGGTQQTAEDITSQQQFLVHTFNRTDLILETDDEAASYAGFVLYQTKDPELRFTSMTVAGIDDPDALFPQMLGREIGDRITLSRQPPGGGTLVRDGFIVGISHEVPGPNEWRTTWSLQSATRWAFMTLNDPTLGTLDDNALAF